MNTSVTTKRQITTDLLYIPLLLNGILILIFGAIYFYNYTDPAQASVLSSNFKATVKQVNTFVKGS